MFGRKIDVGKLGERLAVIFLEKRGYEIMERNFNCPFGEIDIIAKDGEVMTFIEVKTRRSFSFGLPFEVVIGTKQKHIVNVAYFYLARRGLRDADCRFDVVSVLFENGHKTARINLIKNAFAER